MLKQMYFSLPKVIQQKKFGFMIYEQTFQISRKGNPLTEKNFLKNFDKIIFYKKLVQETERFQKRTIKQIQENHFNLDFKFIKDHSINRFG